MNSGFCFSANEESERFVVITDSYNGEVVIVPIMGTFVKYHRARVASVKRIRDAIVAGEGVEMPSLSDVKVRDILRDIVANSRINKEVKDFLLADLKKASDSEQKR